MAANIQSSMGTKKLLDNLSAEVHQERKRQQLRLDKAQTKDAAVLKKKRFGFSFL
jgi:hypothetical protein